jgi:methanogenic corrinoid protein MtbC1
MEVLAPAVEQVEEAWYRGDIGMDGLRFANAYLRGKLLSLLQAYPSRHSAPLVLVGCAPMEVHELHALMLAVLLRSHGFRVEYLGPDINIDDLADYATYELPSLVVLWANSAFTAGEMRRMQEKLKKVRTAPLFGYSGHAFEEKPALAKDIPGAYLGNTLEIALGNVKSILKSRKKVSAN